MSLPQQIKSFRCWMSKRSGKSLTDIGYNITLDPNLRAYRDCHIRTIKRNKPMLAIRGNSISKEEEAMLADEEHYPSVVTEQQFAHGIDELKKFKESINSALEHRKNDGLQLDVSWIHHFTDDQSLNKYLENGLSPCNNDDLTVQHVDIQVYEGYFYGCKHWNFFCNDDDMGAIILSLKMELLHGKEYVRMLVRSSLGSLHVVTLPSSLGVYEHYCDAFSWTDTLTQLLNLTKPLQVIKHHTAGMELVKLDRVFIKSDFKIGVLYVKHGQQSEDEIFSNTSHSTAFEMFLHLLGDRVNLKDFNNYSGGLDTSNSLNGTQSIYTEYRSNRIMFHVPTMMPNPVEDKQYLNKKRHVGNDVLCVVFTDQPETSFSPQWIKSQFIYAYILVQVLASPTNHLKFKVSVICRQEVPWFGPRLTNDGTFDEGEVFREWFLEKIINGDRACYKAPKFAAVQQRTRSQIMGGILEKETEGVNERGYSPSVTPSASNYSSLESLEGLFPDVDYLDDSSPKLKYFFSSQSEGINSGDVAFLAGKTYKKRIYGMRSVMCCKSRVFRDMLTDWALPRNLIAKSAQIKDDSLVKLALKKVSAQAMMQHNSRKGKFAIETSAQTLATLDQYVTTTSITKGGHTYGLSLDCIGRKREFIMNDFEADIFSGVIDYIHNNHCVITYETLPGLLCAARYYELPELRLSCLNRRDDVITVTTVCRMLNIVEEYMFFKDAKELQDKLLLFVVDNIEEISSCKDYFTILTKSRIVLVLSQDWKCYQKLKAKVLVIWAKCRDIHDWRNLAQSVITCCHDHMVLDDFILDESQDM